MFDMILGLESYVKIVVWWLTVTVYDMPFILSFSHTVDCSLSFIGASDFYRVIDHRVVFRAGGIHGLAASVRKSTPHQHCA